ncbi:uncharacterized protein [Epargyreus clarus]|uniref:uncharacterized protein n=1 Tax=Epargyreus clarus TaxID=520877 RepID=UPI003C2E4F38
MESSSSHTVMNVKLEPKKNIDDKEINEIVFTLLQKCKEEMLGNCLNKPLENHIERVAYYTGLSKKKINEIACTWEINYENKYFELKQRIEILKCISDMYVTKINPTYRSIYTMCHSVNTHMNFYQFRYMMNISGYEYRKNLLGQDILIEDPDLTFERYHYLKQILKFRLNNAPIYFIDEIFVDKTCTFPKPWIKNIDISSEACDGYVFFHAISKMGCINGFFCSPTSKNDFVKWITHIFLPTIQEPSIIVMDNNDLHRSSVNVITKYHSKEEMLKYLRLHNIPCSDKFHKAELYELITQLTVKDERYDIADILKSHGHNVLWLPSNFHDLSMTHFLWKYILNSKTTDPPKMEVREIKMKLFASVMKLDHKHWKIFDDNVSKLEKQIYDIDMKTSEALENNYSFSDNLLDIV